MPHVSTLAELRLRAFCVCNTQSQPQISRLHPQWMPESPAVTSQLVYQFKMRGDLHNCHQLAVLGGLRDW